MAENKLVMEQESFAKKLIKYLEGKLHKDIKVDFQRIIKTNDVLMHSITMRKEEEAGAKNYYIEDLFPMYTSGKTIEEIGDYLIETRKIESKQLSESEELLIKMLDYNYMLDGHIYIRLINREKSKKFLEGKVYIPWLDLAIVFYNLISNNEQGISSIAVPENIAAMWGKPLKEVLDDTLEVMQTTFPIKRVKLQQMIEDLVGDDKFAEMMNPPETSMNCDMLIQTNEAKINGAATILYKNCLKEIAENNQIEKIFIIPSSVHECILLIDPENIASGKDLVTMIREVNAFAVEPEELLSENLYIYNLHTNEITIWKEKLF